MKKITFLLFTFLTFNFQLSAQNITLEITGTPCDGGSPYTLTPFGTNGKNQYNAVVGGSGDQIRMEWSSSQSRWELNLYDSGNTFQETEFFNTADTPSDPPCFSFDNSWSAASGATCSASAISNLTGNCDTSAANVASASIPTLSEWGLIILALLLMTFGTLQLIRKESKETT